MDDIAETMAEEVWTGQEWRPTSMVTAGLAGGDPLMDEITEAEARRISPDAFEGRTPAYGESVLADRFIWQPGDLRLL